MSLNDVNINYQVKAQTIKTIQTSDFQTLKQAIIDRKPLGAVISAIESNLAAELVADKEAFKLSATEAACKAQIQQDAVSESRDAQEEITDKELKQRLTAERSELAAEVASLSQNVNTREKLLLPAEAVLSAATMSKASVDRQIQDIRMRREAILRRYPTVVYPQVHTHADAHIHVHSQAPVVHAIYHTPEDSAELLQLAGLESGLMLQQQQLATQISLQEAMVSSDRASLKSIQSEKQEKESQLNNLKWKLNTEIPHRATQRTQRVAERAARAQARLNDDPSLLQLSTENRQRLAYDIRVRNDELNNKKASLLSSANNSSYPVFMEQLKLKLNSPMNLAINGSEVDALGKVSSLLETYLAMEEQESKLANIKGSLDTKLANQRSRLQEAQSTYQRYYNSNPQLSEQNAQLTADNFELRDQANAYRDSANQQFTFSGGSALLALGGGLLVGLMFMNPLLFIVPGLFALAAVGTLIAAIVFKYKEWSSLQRVETNEHQIDANSQQVEQQTGDMNIIYYQTIPTLQKEIAQLQQSVQGAENELENHRKLMRLHMSKMEGTTAVQVSPVGIYSASLVPPSAAVDGPVTSYTTPTPSAPPMDDIPVTSLQWN